MSWSERYVQDHKRRTNCAVHLAYAQLASDPLTINKFQELLFAARKRSPRLFEAPLTDGRHPGIDALANLSRFRELHRRSPTDWPGTSSSWRPAIASLAHHLVCDYQVPAFLAAAWWATDAAAEAKRLWFLTHSRGASFRSLDLPIAMTRKMEHIFLASHNHLSIEHAMRRAELLALAAPPKVVAAIMSTRLATDLSDGAFWRTVWQFLIANARDMDHSQIGPMIDYIQAVLEGQRLLAQQTGADFNASQTEFSMKGRTLSSMLRAMRAWHNSLGKGGAWFSWRRLPIEPLFFKEPAKDDAELPRHWQLIELTDSAQLRREGAALHHCVASYADRCHRGISSIWSLRMWQGEKIHHVITVEVDPKSRTIVQARGVANRTPSGRSLRLLQDWAVRERLQMSI